MSAFIPPAWALFFGSLMAGVAAALIGPLTLYAYSAMGPRSISAREALDGFLWLGAIFGGIGLAASVLAGFPLLLVLRAFNRLSYVTAVATGSTAGTAICLLFMVFDSLRLEALPIGSIIGAFAGLIALGVANAVSPRPKNALGERLT